MSKLEDDLPVLFWIVMKRGYLGWNAFAVVKETEKTITLKVPGWNEGTWSYDRKNKPSDKQSVRLSCETTAKELADKLEGIRTAANVEINLLRDECDAKINKIVEEANQ